MYAPTGPQPYLTTPRTLQDAGVDVAPAGSYATSAYYAQQVGQIALSAYELYKARRAPRFEKAYATANLVVDVAALVPMLTPFAGLQRVANLQMALVHGWAEREKAKREKQRFKKQLGNFEFDYSRLARGGLPAGIAARIAAARSGIKGASAEAVFPLGSSSPYYNPVTRASDTLRGLTITFGEGEAAESERLRYADDVYASYAGRPSPGEGLQVQPFVKRRK